MPICPSHILNAFISIPGGIEFSHHESAFYGPYNAILNFLFPASENFLITPQYLRSSEGLGHTNDHNVVFVVEHTQHRVPVFFLEVKHPDHYKTLAGRAQADKRMRLLFAEFAERVELEKLYDVSALGVQVGYYELEGADGSIYPREIPYDGNYVTNVAPVNRWPYNILSEGGWNEVVRIAEAVKTMVRAKWPVMR
jgi:hypothetical protein